MRRRLLGALGLTVLFPFATGGCQATPTLAAATVVDLSHAYDEETVYWPTAEGFRLTIDSKGEAAGGYWYEANSFSSSEHGGTHLDAPVHFARGKLTVDQIPLEDLIGPGALIDVASGCAADRDHQVTIAEIVAWESQHGRLPDGAIVLLNTGFHQYWPDRERYMGTAERGADAVPKLHFPGLHPDAARWLVTERSIAAVGLDTPSIDHGPSTTFETHRILFEANIPALENLAALDQLPAVGFDVIALPMKIRGGSGGPVRVAAVLR